MQTIDFDWIKRIFPSIVGVFGENALAKQVSVFNTQLAGSAPADHEPYLLAKRMIRAGVKSPHRALLNTFSLLHEPCDENPYVGRFSAPVLLLEHRLAQLHTHGIELTEYRQMMVAPHSFESLIAEVDVLGCLLDGGGKISSHVLSGKATPKNYDVDWSYDGFTIRGDVKYFRDWLRKSDSDVLGTLKMLVSPDLACGITVHMGMHTLTEDMLTDVALEVLELYRIANGDLVPPSKISVVDGGAGRRIACRQIPFDDWYVREVELMPGTQSESIIVIESGIGDGSEDENSIRRNLLSAATQVPASSVEEELAMVFVGSAIPNSVEDLRPVLFGQPQIDYENGVVTRLPGFFSPDTEESDLRHIQAIVFFSPPYVENTLSAMRPRVQRFARAFCREGSLSARQVGALQKVEHLLQCETILSMPLYRSISDSAV